MIDALTRKPIRISNPKTVYPYISVPVSQVDPVRQLLDGHDIRYSVEEYQIAFNGQPPTTLIYLARGTNPDTVQSLLDSVP